MSWVWKKFYNFIKFVNLICLFVSSADNICKQFGIRPGRTKCRAWSGSKMFDTLMVFLIFFPKKFNFEIKQQTTKKHAKLPRRQSVKSWQKKAKNQFCPNLCTNNIKHIWCIYWWVSGLLLRVRNRKIIFLFLNQNICCGYLKEQSQWDSSFERPKHKLKIMDKKVFTI